MTYIFSMTSLEAGGTMHVNKSVVTPMIGKTIKRIRCTSPDAYVTLCPVKFIEAIRVVSLFFLSFLLFLTDYFRLNEYHQSEG